MDSQVPPIGYVTSYTDQQIKIVSYISPNLFSNRPTNVSSRHHNTDSLHTVVWMEPQYETFTDHLNPTTPQWNTWVGLDAANWSNASSPYSLSNPTDSASADPSVHSIGDGNSPQNVGLLRAQHTVHTKFTAASHFSGTHNYHALPYSAPVSSTSYLTKSGVNPSGTLIGLRLTLTAAEDREKLVFPGRAGAPPVLLSHSVRSFLFTTHIQTAKKACVGQPLCVEILRRSDEWKR